MDLSYLIAPAIILIIVFSIYAISTIHSAPTSDRSTVDDVQRIILDYESDTFDAHELDVTAHEARMMAYLLISDFKVIIQCGGTISCDGDRLRELLDDIRYGS